MYLGAMAELADVGEIYEHPGHPYTVALLSAIPDPDPRHRKKRINPEGRHPITGQPAIRLSVPHALLAARAAGQPRALLRGDAGAPRGRAGHQVACHFTDQVSTESIALASRSAST